MKLDHVKTIMINMFLISCHFYFGLFSVIVFSKTKLKGGCGHLIEAGLYGFYLQCFTDNNFGILITDYLIMGDCLIHVTRGLAEVQG